MSSVIFAMGLALDFLVDVGGFEWAVVIMMMGAILRGRMAFYTPCSTHEKINHAGGNL